MEGVLDLNLVSTGIRTLAMLFLVLGLLVGTLYFLHRFSMRRRLTHGEADIRLLSSLSLSTRDRIQVVEIAGEKIVLGISPGGISCITKLGNSKAENNAEVGQDRHDSEQ